MAKSVEAHSFYASALWLGIQTPSADLMYSLDCPRCPSLPTAGQANLLELTAGQCTVLSSDCQLMYTP